MNTTRALSTVYFFSVGLFFILVGAWPLTPIGAFGFLVLGALSFLMGILFLLQAPRAADYLKKILMPLTYTCWVVFTIVILINSFRHHEEVSPWSEVIVDSLVCLALGFALTPFFFISKGTRS